MTFASQTSEADQRKAGRAAKAADLMFIFIATTNKADVNGLVR
jgi:hypothetical protein